MADANWKTILDNMFKALQNSYKSKDDRKMNIAIKQSEYELQLDEMWRIYGSGNIDQLLEYQKQLNLIKSSGCRVLRNSCGKHKIMIE